MCGAPAQRAFDPNVAAVILDDAIGGRQAKAPALEFGAESGVIDAELVEQCRV